MERTASRAFTMQPAGGNDAQPPSGITLARRLYVGGAGDVVVLTSFGDQATYTVPVGEAGIYLHVEVSKVLNSGTTASGIVGEYWGGA